VGVCSDSAAWGADEWVGDVNDDDDVDCAELEVLLESPAAE